MGVQGLWELLAPVGRRVSVETLAGKKLAIDASIWMVQFMKAMRDEKGETIRNAHLLGFFRRICKLLFLRTKPVFVFDGGTPALKRRTVIARRRQRENAQAKVRKTAEKLLLNHLKTLKLRELANDIKNQRLKQDSDTKGEKKSDQIDLAGCAVVRRNEKELDKITGAKFAPEEDTNLSETMLSRSCNQKDLDEMLAASIVAEEDGLLARKGVTFAAVHLSEEEGDADVEILLPEFNSEVDPSVLAALPQSMQLEILSQLKGKKTEGPLNELENQKLYEVNDKGKGKGILLDEIGAVGCSSRSDDVITREHTQDKVDEMLAASIMAEENEKIVNNASTSGAFISEEEDDIYDEDEEMILPEMHGKVDPSILASLPPSMQLDLLVQMRERLIAENRQKYQKVKKDPTKFSELQIQAYLKTVAFRREINEVQKAAAGGGVAGVQTSRIASEANREYIFSTSFTGDKQELTSTKLEQNKATQPKSMGNHPSEGFVNNTEPANDSSTSRGFVRNEPGGDLDENIQTYLDERGQFRVSRLRAMGMRMTRDIQRNLDLMKEIEQERTDADKAANNNTFLNGEKICASKGSSNQVVGTSDKTNVDLAGENMRNEHSVLGDASIEISFVDDYENKCLDGDDDLFASLVAGNSGTNSCAENTLLKEQVSDSNSDCDWEEGIIEGQSNVFSGNVKGEMKPSVAKDNYSDESDVEWEEGVHDGSNSTLLCAAEPGKIASRGCLEEEADLQEALRRSLENIGDRELNCTSSINEHTKTDEVKSDYASNHENLVGSGVKDFYEDSGVQNREVSMGASTLQREGGTEQNDSYYKIIDGNDKLDSVARNNLQTSQSRGGQSESFVAFNSEKMGTSVKKPCAVDMGSHSEDLLPNANERMKNDIHMVAEQFLGTLNEDGKGSTYCNKSFKVNSLGASEEDKNNYSNEGEPFDNSSKMSKPVAPFVDSSLEESTEDLDTQSEFPRENNRGSCEETKSNHGKDAVKALGYSSADAVEISLEEEMRILGQEYTNLENEQRKLERNAESVNSELFTECQELLQMFGLPYIIAPMEAEAQCAYLELAKLVDGVVTDDSDVFLFGARSVYKNIFDDRKYVETYFMEDIEKELGLTREKLIRMALLLGSDYTEGVSGIGIVNAIEVVNAFPEEDGLLKFRQWVESPDPTILGMFDAKSESSTRKRGSKVEEKFTNCSMEEAVLDQNISHVQEQKESLDYIQEIKQIFINNHRNVSKNWHIPLSFPSETVISAYSCPQVDKSTDPFAWGKPDHLVLRKLCWEKFGWTNQKADELLLPVLKEYNKNETQLRLEAFYTFNERFAKIRSKRIKKAVKGITGNQSSELIDESAEDLSKNRKIGRGSPVELGDNRSETLKGTEENPADMKRINLKQTMKRKISGDTVAKVQSRKKRNFSDPASALGPSEVENLEPYVKTGEKSSDGDALNWNKSGRGKGRGRGVGLCRGKRKGSLGFDTRETTSSDNGSDNHEQRVHGKKSKEPQEVRRSTRARKIINYAIQDLEMEDSDDPFVPSNKTDLNEEPIDEGLSRMPDYAATDFSIDKESMINLSLKEDLSRNYLDSGGGFCADEGETSHPGATNCDSSVPADSFKDYHEVGGGFCVDDDETGHDHNEIHNDTTVIVEDTADLTHCAGFLGEADYDKNCMDQSSSVDGRAGIELRDGVTGCTHKIELKHDHENARSNHDHSESGVWISENADGNNENYMAAFSAMPFLRKKRKKS